MPIRRSSDQRRHQQNYVDEDAGDQLRPLLGFSNFSCPKSIRMGRRKFPIGQVLQDALIDVGSPKMVQMDSNVKGKDNIASGSRGENDKEEFYYPSLDEFYALQAKLKKE